MSAEMIDKAFAAASATDSSANAFVYFFDSIGMMRGEMAPVYRAAFGFSVGTAAMFLFRPSFAFDASGAVRPWRFSDPGSRSATGVPWFVVPTVLAIISGVFI